MPGAVKRSKPDSLMGAYAPESSLGWLDLDSAASERVGTLIRSLEEPTTLDVLGLGTVRDAFSDMLSPGTSTIQTRLRYFIFLPCILRGLEEERVSPADFADRLRHDESQLIDCLRHLGSNQGVIGYAAGRDLRRMPSEIYWGGLGAWGIRQLDLSLSEYGKRVSTLGRLRHERDDDGNPTRRAVSMWPDIRRPKDFLQGDITFDLGPEEAQYLADCIRRRHPDSLLAVLCGMPGVANGVGYPWELPTHGLPDRLVETLHDARCFSELTVGPQLVYNMLLARRARDEFGWDTHALEASQRKSIEEWRRLVDDRHAALQSWVAELPEFWRGLADHRVGVGTRGFVSEVVTRAMDDPVGFADDPAIHAVIRDREILLKGKRARLANRSALENWNQQPVGGQFDYRWPVTQSYLADIAAAELQA